MFWSEAKIIKIVPACVQICDPLCENQLKYFFCDLLFVFYKKNHPSYGNEHSVKI